MFMFDVCSCSHVYSKLKFYYNFEDKIHTHEYTMSIDTDVSVVLSLSDLVETISLFLPSYNDFTRFVIALPSFGRHLQNPKKLSYWKEHFTVCTKTEKK